MSRPEHPCHAPCRRSKRSRACMATNAIGATGHDPYDRGVFPPGSPIQGTLTPACRSASCRLSRSFSTLRRLTSSSSAASTSALATTCTHPPQGHHHGDKPYSGCRCREACRPNEPGHTWHATRRRLHKPWARIWLLGKVLPLVEQACWRREPWLLSGELLRALATTAGATDCRLSPARRATGALAVIRIIMSVPQRSRGGAKVHNRKKWRESRLKNKPTKQPPHTCRMAG